METETGTSPMQQNKITFIIQDRVYKVDMTQRSTLRNIAAEDRKQLLQVLQQLQQTDSPERTLNQKPGGFDDRRLPQPKARPTQTQNPGKDRRLNNTDADAVMQQLIMEQQSEHHGVPEKNTLYKWFAIILLVIVVLTWLF